ncbi:YVTN family beta-propeller repeat protein [Terriglobus aquaticus]|uniref:YNCE-like beta-propeller domain-containing protein n=1 Tax=Terriglobus aquaticus TaxID=940139 RepID=A0ABW9KJF2_9BACT|nr:hypothetical protein [Terriglobus aquaticus]
MSQPAERQITPAALEIDGQARRLYAADAGGNRLLSLDLKTGQQTSVAVGQRPIGVAMDTVAHRGYVVNAGSGTVSVVDLQAERVVATVRTDIHPYAIAVDSRLHRVYVSNVFSNQLTMIDGATNQATVLKAGSQDALLADAQAHQVWLCSYESDHLALLDEANLAIRSIPSVNHVWALIPGLREGEIFAVSIGSDELLRILPGENAEKVKVGSMPDALAIDNDRHRIYVANYADNTVTVLDADTLKTVTTVPVGHTPQALAVDIVRQRAYVANTHDSTVSVLDTKDNRVIWTVPVAGVPYELKLDPESGDVFAATFGSVPFRRVVLEGK